MLARWLAAILILPGTVMVAVPAALLGISHRLGLDYSLARAPSARFFAALAVIACGLASSLWAMGLFFRFGKGTPAPWDPPTRFVVRGAYRYVRNPMIIGLLVTLLGAALLFGSWLVLGWALLFFLGNCLFFPLVEEPRLRQRFGADYEEYCRHVGRWLPRLRPWRQPDRPA